MRIAIIGGGGMIGSALARELINHGHDPLILSRHASEGEVWGGISVAQWDGLNADRLVQIVDGADALVNLAGESIGASRWTEKRLKVLHDSRLLPGGAVAAAWKKMQVPPPVLVQASAVGIYGNSDETSDENTHTADDLMARLCKAWEASTESVTALGTRRVVIRSGVVLEGHKGILPQMMLPFTLFVGGPIGRGGQWISWIHIQDEVKAIRFLLEGAAFSGVFNLTSPNPLTNSQFGRELSAVMHRPYWFPTPALLLKIALGRMSSLVLEGQKVMPNRLMKAGFEFTYPDLPSALANLIG